MSIYSDKLAQVQVKLNCLYSAAPKCTQRYARPGFGIPSTPGFLDDIISYYYLEHNKSSKHKTLSQHPSLPLGC